MALNTSINRQRLISVFPDLGIDANFIILSECSCIYNCIAWAMGYTDRWVDIYTAPGHWWPNGVARNTLSQTLIQAFKAEGFEESDNCLIEEGYSKVVLYKKEFDDEWTHAARLVSSDVEHSKFGLAWDGHHSHNVLCNTSKGKEHQSYGVAYAYMKRRELLNVPTNMKGNITVDLRNLALLKSKLAK